MVEITDYNEYTERLKQFVSSFVENITDENRSEQAKSTYFLDKQETLNKVKNSIDEIIKNPPDDVPDEMLGEIVTQKMELDKTLEEFKKTLIVSEDTVEEDLAVEINNDTIKDAMENNTTTKEIVSNLSKIDEMAKSTPKYTHMIVCDDNIELVSATSREKLNAILMATANLYPNARDIKVYKMSLTEIPTQKRTIVSV